MLHTLCDTRSSNTPAGKLLKVYTPPRPETVVWVCCLVPPAGVRDTVTPAGPAISSAAHPADACPSTTPLMENPVYWKSTSSPPLH